MNVYKSKIEITLVLMLVVLVCGAIFLYYIGIDALEGQLEFPFFADSGTYHAVSRGLLDGLGGQGESVAIGANFLGPRLILWLAADNYYAVMVLNMVLFVISVSSISGSLRLNTLKFSVLLLMNPITISSLLSVNKEIISFVVVAFMVQVIMAKTFIPKVIAMLLSLIGAMLVRWEMAIFVFSFFYMISPCNPFRRRRYLSVFILLGCMSIAYFLAADILKPILDNFALGASQYEGSGLQEQLTIWQSNGAYILVFPLKALHLLFGLGLRFDRLIAPDDLYNDVLQLLHSTSLLLLAFAVWRSGRFRLSNDYVYLSVVYVVIFAITPIYAPRYFYPVFVLWGIALLLPGKGALMDANGYPAGWRA